MGTDPGAACAATSTANDESGADAWPYDFNDDQKATLGDVLRYIGRVNMAPPNPTYDVRFDLSINGAITLVDVLKFIPVMNQSCALPP